MQCPYCEKYIARHFLWLDAVTVLIAAATGFVGVLIGYVLVTK